MFLLFLGSQKTIIKAHFGDSVISLSDPTKWLALEA